MRVFTSFLFPNAVVFLVTRRALRTVWPSSVLYAGRFSAQGRVICGVSRCRLVFRNLGRGHTLLQLVGMVIRRRAPEVRSGIFLLGRSLTTGRVYVDVAMAFTMACSLGVHPRRIRELAHLVRCYAQYLAIHAPLDSGHVFPHLHASGLEYLREVDCVTLSATTSLTQ